MLIDAYSSFISELLTYILWYCHTLCCLCWPAASCAKLPEAAPSHGPGYSFLYKITSKPYGRSWNITIIIIDITCYHIHLYTNYIILYCIILYIIFILYLYYIYIIFILYCINYYVLSFAFTICSHPPSPAPLTSTSTSGIAPIIELWPFGGS